MSKIILKSINNFIIKVEGKMNYQQNQFFVFQNGVKAFLFSANEEEAYLIVNDLKNNLKIGEELKIVNTENINTKSSFFGKIINIDNEIIFEKNTTYSSQEEIDYGNSPIFQIARGIIEREPLNQPLETGLLGIDVFVPIGKGQRELILGDRKTGKTQIALSSFLNNIHDENIRLIYASIGQKSSNTAKVFEILENHNALEKAIILTSPADNAYQQYLTPYVAMAHAENLCRAGFDVVLILDDLTKHANIYREISLLINRPAGREAYPGDIFYTHSKLLERSGKFKNEGTITALPIIETVSGDISALIPSNVISITDGQIITSVQDFNKGKFPAINYQLSVSRTGSKVQSFEMAKISKHLFKIYSNYKKNLKLKDIKFNLSPEMYKNLAQGEILSEALIQREWDFYSRELIILLGRIILWDLLKNTLNKWEIIQFLHLLFKYNKSAQKIAFNIKENKNIDELILKNFLYSAINDFLIYKDKLPIFQPTIQFISITPKEIQSYFTRNKGVNYEG